MELNFDGVKIGDREKSHSKIETDINSKTPVGGISRNFISLYSNRVPSSAEKILAPTTWATGKTGDSVPKSLYNSPYFDNLGRELSKNIVKVPDTRHPGKSDNS